MCNALRLSIKSRLHVRHWQSLQWAAMLVFTHSLNPTESISIPGRPFRSLHTNHKTSLRHNSNTQWQQYGVACWQTCEAGAHQRWTVSTQPLQPCSRAACRRSTTSNDELGTSDWVDGWRARLDDGRTTWPSRSSHGVVWNAENDEIHRRRRWSERETVTAACRGRDGRRRDDRRLTATGDGTRCHSADETRTCGPAHDPPTHAHTRRAMTSRVTWLTRRRRSRCCPVSERLAEQTKRLVLCAVQLLSDYESN